MNTFEQINNIEEDKTELEILQDELKKAQKKYEELLPRKGMSDDDDKLIESLENEINNLTRDIEKLKNPS